MTMHADAFLGDVKNVSRRAHSGQKSMQTAAACVLPRRCKTRKGCEPARMEASTTKPQRGAEGCGAPGANAQCSLTLCRRDTDVQGLAPKRPVGQTYLPADHSRDTKRSRRNPEVVSPEPTPVCKDSPDARLCGRGWHTRWPPPVRATAHPVQTSLRDFFARCQAAPANGMPPCPGREASFASRS